MKLLPSLLPVLLIVGCVQNLNDTSYSPPLFAHLERAEGAGAGLATIRSEFVRRNPGYDMHYDSALVTLKADRNPRVVFVQTGQTTMGVGDRSSEVTKGDVILLRQGEILEAKSQVGAVIFEVPLEPDRELPTFIRPDWDPKITDVPGGCATETGAYRRILLTWEAENGPYLYHALNAHRVRMMDSFTHFHPADKGFDEFYLVQMALPDARILTSHQTERIRRPETVNESDLRSLIQAHALKVGDLVYIPRGTVHRGFGGVLAQVITVPGFKPGATIGVDQNILSINERFRLEGERALPFNTEAAKQVAAQ